jgi:hypothetical protein
MKVTLTIELNLPDAISKLTDGELGQVLFDNYVNYVTKCHAIDAVKWYAKAKVGSESEDEVGKHIYERHDAWIDYTEQPSWSFKRS